MILIDFNQTLFSAILVNKNPDIELIRGVVFNAFLLYNKKFSSKYGNIVLAMDCNDGYWRKSVFPYYKHGRKKQREKKDMNWLEIANQLKSEVIEFAPYKKIVVSHAEADDIIAVLAGHIKDERNLILSRDDDFRQPYVHRNNNVDQYSQITKKFIPCENLERKIQLKILQGDSGDSIPNMLSPENSIVDGIRQKPITEKLIEDYFNNQEKYILNNFKRYEQNKTLIDLSMIPETIVNNIIDAFDESKNGSIKNLHGYFMSHKLRLLGERIHEFKPVL